MKHYIRTLWPGGEKPLWDNEPQREALRRYLNDEGFYVLTGEYDSLDVYAIEYWEPIDVRLMKRSLAKIQEVWYKMVRKNKEGVC